MLWNVLYLFVYFVSQCHHPSTHPYISFMIFLNFLFLLFLLCATAHALEVDVSSVHMHHDKWHLTVPVHTAPSIKSAGATCVTVTCTLNTKFEMHTSREFPGYWWLFRMRNLLRNGARLAEERRRWTILIFNHFRFATLKQLLHTAITTADWCRLYELLYM